MRRPSFARQSTLRFNLTPMIDVVFNLIIFFLAASHLARSENSEPVQLPKAKTGGKEDKASRRLLVTVLPTGEYHVTGELVLLDEIEQQISSGKQSAGSSSYELRIRADSRVEYRVIEPLLLAAAKAGVTQVKFVVDPTP